MDDTNVLILMVIGIFERSCLHSKQVEVNCANLNRTVLTKPILNLCILVALLNQCQITSENQAAISEKLLIFETVTKFDYQPFIM